MTQENTVRQVELAYEAGSTQAYAEHLMGVESMIDLPVLSTDEDIHDLAFRVTGEKLDADSDRAQELADAFEDGYVDKWEELTT